MLNFSTKPDKVFTEIVTNAFDFAIDTLKINGCDVLEDVLPNASRVFDLETATETLERLSFYHKSPSVYDMNDYHFILIYDVLEGYCELFNEDEGESMTIEGTKMTKIDFDSLIGLYFFDEAFLTPKKRILDHRVVNSPDCSKDTLGVILGYEPSPSDLENRLVPEGEDAFPEDDAPLFHSESTEYPDYSIIDEMDRQEARRAACRERAEEN